VPESAVADTGPLRHLAEIGREVVLTVFSQVVVPDAVESELTRSGFWPQVQSALGSGVRVEPVRQEEIDAIRARLSAFRLHHADLAVAALAEHWHEAVVLTDDLQLRRAMIASRRVPIGSVGILFRAFHQSVLDRRALEVAVHELHTASTLYLSAPLWEEIQEALKSL
jgi:predicted nucleic acid-binding protein